MVVRVRRLAGARRGGGSPWPPRIGGGRVCVAVLELCCGGTAMSTKEEIVRTVKLVNTRKRKR